MPSTFRMDNMPFSLLTESEQSFLRSHLDLAYFQKGEVILKAGEKPEGIFVILKGRVAESESSGGEDSHIYVNYTDEDYFGSWSVLRGEAIHDFIAEEETICHILPTPYLFDLMSTNSLFADYFQQNLSTKTEIVAQHSATQDMAEFMLARVNDEITRDPLIVLEGTSIEDATSLMREQHADCMLVKRGNRYGMVTGTDLLDAVIINKRPQTDDVADIASYRLIVIEPDDYLFNALIIMTRQKIERVVVMRGEELVGVVELTDVLSAFSSHTHVIGVRIDRAQTVEDLCSAAENLNALTKALVVQGVKPRFAMDLLAAMNGRVIAKLFDLMIPPDMQPHVCLVVMGSEGRGEQILKTDQDNAIIYRDGLDWPEMMDVMQAFSDQLVAFGFPPCPGNIMVSNPFWVNSLSEWTEKLQGWAEVCDGEALMNLAIAIDAKPAAGNPAIFKAGRNWFFRYLKNNDVFFSHFARAAVEFQTPLTFFGSLKDKGELDIKKGGIFPIVHGVRTLALEHRVKATNTFKRLEALVEAGVIKEGAASELIEALGVFVSLRLGQQIQRLDESDEGVDLRPNIVELTQLDKMERDLLRDALHVVKGFKKTLALRYRLDA
ncbi:MAG: putative nucleotidyltransferase substrate binding domain-containing protein [Pontibacterium sp.]